MIIVLMILVIIVLLLLIAGYAAFFVACVRLNIEPKPGKSLQFIADDIETGAAWFRAQNPERVQITSDDGLRLVGYFLPAYDAKGTLLLLHGYRGSPFFDFAYSVRDYHELGWNVLAVCQRAHGESDGKYITYGIKERFDARDWALYLADRFGPEHNVVMIGISMGCSTALMSLGTDLPDNVKCVVADCGFTSPYEEFVHVLKRRHIPVHPVLDIAELYAKAFAGFSFKDYSTITALQTNRRPVLFVHGEKDTFVPVRFAVENYAACTAEKQLITVPEAGHGTSYVYAKESCHAALRDFLNKYGH